MKKFNYELGMGVFLELPHSLKSEVQSNDAVKLKCLRLMSTCPSTLGVVLYVTADMMESDASFFFAWNAPKMVSFGRQIIIVFGVIMVFAPWLAIIP